MRHALTVALQGFDGAIILVSHDRHLVGNTVDEFLLIDQGRCQVFEGDLSEYESWLQQDSGTGKSDTGKADTGQSKTALSGSPGMTANAKQSRQQAALQRQQTGPLRKEIRALEKSMSKLTDSLAVLEEKLSDPGIYDDARKDELKELLAKQGEQQSELERVEEAWLEKSSELESAQ
jgi:ATP-binding cassette subfamily F protein 3